ncbi:GDP-mannose transporter into the lumen of the Golgi [Friedmanniomyces endolithicus]|uniref:GDP-mannose transporter n=1 Tax=Rachicladosporium monterosium TaxID=1507873 RepID=A0ABR0LBX4_9PEZI|nr:GDP-mannose transporter into the lumen of the Golgi [Friedmanniomyces endolithicus]KAK1088545.1 GDP-mannose transporter into the lumen of the Golgi [Friedmanniomyces endolithicus]KAK5146450.1 GDP-mannose transporter into the lumen of the Golgi [Rachicladosporium monterosium]
MADEKKRDDGLAIEMGEDRSTNGHAFDAQPKPILQTNSAPALGSVTNNPAISIAAYCGSSILMTVTNKYVLSGTNFNLNFMLLAVQSIVCIIAIQSCKQASLITFRDFHIDEARKWFPISLLLIGMIYTSTKALQFLSIPVYTIFKNLTIILIAYGEVLWFGGSVTSMQLLSFGLMVLSSVIAAWADIQHALQSHGGSGDVVSGEAAAKISTLNAGYVWMMMNCFCSATYLLCMRKRIKLTNFKDFDTMYYNNLLSIPILLLASLFIENWSSANLNLNFPPENRNWILITMVISGLSSVFISYTSAWCVRITSSTTYSMVGALNKLPLAISGLVFFDAPVTVGSVGAIAVGFISGLVYTVAKIWQGKPGQGASGGGKGGAGQSGSLLPVSASVQSMKDSLKS